MPTYGFTKRLRKIKVFDGKKFYARHFCDTKSEAERIASGLKKQFAAIEKQYHSPLRQLYRIVPERYDPKYGANNAQKQHFTGKTIFAIYTRGNKKVI